MVSQDSEEVAIAEQPSQNAQKLMEGGQEFATREVWLQEVWTRKLVEELWASDAPVLEKLKLSLNPERASELLAAAPAPIAEVLWKNNRQSDGSGFLVV